MQSPIANQTEPRAEGVDKILFGRFMLPDSTEHPCQIADLTADGAVFIANVEVTAGLHVVAYIDEIGRMEGTVEGAADGGFRLAFKLTDARRQRIASRLDWLHNKKTDDDYSDQRRHPRFEPKQSKSHITMQDGRVYECEVIDISISGTAVRTSILPGLGTNLFVGKMRGRVVRHLDDGIGVEFIKHLEQSTLQTQLSD